MASRYLPQGNLFSGGCQPQHAQEQRLSEDRHSSVPQKPPFKPVGTGNSRRASQEAFPHPQCREIQTLKQLEARKRWRGGTLWK